MLGPVSSPWGDEMMQQTLVVFSGPDFNIDIFYGPFMFSFTW